MQDPVYTTPGSAPPVFHARLKYAADPFYRNSKNAAFLKRPFQAQGICNAGVILLGGTLLRAADEGQRTNEMAAGRHVGNARPVKALVQYDVLTFSGLHIFDARHIEAGGRCEFQSRSIHGQGVVAVRPQREFSEPNQSFR